MTEKELLELKENINQAKQEKNKLEGRKEHLTQQLEKDWKCKSLKQAKSKLEQMKEAIKELEEKIETGVAELEEKYEFE